MIESMEKDALHSRKMQKAINKKDIWIVKYGMLLASIFIISVIALLEIYLRTKQISLLDWIVIDPDR